jgi:hypothetical protein
VAGFREAATECGRHGPSPSSGCGRPLLRLAILPRAHAGEAAEHGGEMRLVRKADRGGDLGQRDVRIGQQRLGPVDPALQHEAVRRRAGRALEGTAEMERAEMRDGGDLRQRKRAFAERSLDEIEHPAQASGRDGQSFRRLAGLPRQQARDADGERDPQLLGHQRVGGLRLARHRGQRQGEMQRHAVGRDQQR